MTLPAPCSIEKTPSCMPHAATARRTARATSSEVPGWPRCAFTSTGFPVAKALAVSPPATEKASGKLLEPKTMTGPSGTSIRRRSQRGSGWRSGNATSIRASTHEPSRAKAANIFSWVTVRPRSPVSRARGRPVSKCARCKRSSPSSSISAAMRSKKSARDVPELFPKDSKATRARRIAVSTSATPAISNRPSSTVPSRGLVATNDSSLLRTSVPIIFFPDSFIKSALQEW